MMTNSRALQYFVEVRKIATDEVIKRMGPHSERSAERIERGVSVNLNHEEFYTEIVSNDDDSDD